MPFDANIGDDELGKVQPWQWDIVDMLLGNETVRFPERERIHRPKQIFVFAETNRAFRIFLDEIRMGMHNLPSPLYHRYQFVARPEYLRGCSGEGVMIIIYGEYMDRLSHDRRSEMVRELLIQQDRGTDIRFIKGRYVNTSDVLDSMQYAREAARRMESASRYAAENLERMFDAAFPGGGPEDEDVCEACHDSITSRPYIYDAVHKCWWHKICKEEVDSL